MTYFAALLFDRCRQESLTPSFYGLAACSFVPIYSLFERLSVCRLHSSRSVVMFHCFFVLLNEGIIVLCSRAYLMLFLKVFHTLPSTSVSVFFMFSLSSIIFALFAYVTSVPEVVYIVPFQSNLVFLPIKSFSLLGHSIASFSLFSSFQLFTVNTCSG